MIDTPAGDSLAAVLKRLRARFEDVLNEAVPPGPVALVDFPNHPNVGDSAIWLGECAWLASRLDFPVVFVADQETFDIHELRRAMPVGTILLSGGGNFGDLWPACQALRERYLRELSEYRIVQLPQSIWFGDARAAATAAESARSHPDFTLLVRSGESYDIATRNLGLHNVQLAPDAAFLLDGVVARKASQDIVMLARTDDERRHALHLDGVTAEDWTMDSWPVSHWRLDEVTRWCFGHGKWRGRSAAPRWAAFLARQRVRRGLKQIARGRTLVTDRLHACLLGLLIGRHVIALDNSYGKLQSVMNTWLPDCPDITWVADPAHLAEAVRRVAVQSQGAAELHQAR